VSECEGEEERREKEERESEVARPHFTRPTRRSLVPSFIIHNLKTVLSVRVMLEACFATKPIETTTILHSTSDPAQIATKPMETTNQPSFNK